MAIIKEYDEGSDLSLLDVRYRYSTPDANGKWGKDWLWVTFKDNKTGQKKSEIIERPIYEYFMAKDNIALYHNHLFIERDKVDSIEVPFNDLLKDIANRTNQTNFYYDNLANGNRRANMELHTLYNVFNSDMHIEDNFRYRFDKCYKNNPIMPISKAYFDIETDIKDMVGDFPELGECPINAVSYIFDNKVTSFLLRNPDNSLIEEFEKSINEDLFKELNDFIIYNVGGLKKAKKFNVDKLSYEFIFYDDEIELIKDLFRLININEPDFLLAWNMAFDVPYIIERLKALGYDPAIIMSHPCFDPKHMVAEYYIDEMHKNLYEARGDKYDITSKTVYIDQLIQFASRRKGQAAFPNFKLDTAGRIIAKVRKYDYSDITTQLSELPYLDYKAFVFYNIMDTIVQKCIEEKSKDIDYIYTKCITNNTRMDKGHRQTVYLTNRATKDFWKEGFVIGNNINRHAKDIRFEGALVGDPTHNSDYSKIKLHNQIINIAMNLVDFDYKALYPSCALQDNMEHNTIIAKINIPDKVFEGENPFNKELYERAGNYIDDLICENVILFCHRWLHYASIKEWLEDFKYYFSHIEYPAHIMNTKRLFDHVDPTVKKRLFSRIDPNEPIKLFYHEPQNINLGYYLDQIGRV